MPVWSVLAILFYPPPTDLGGDERVERQAEGEVDEAQSEREAPEGHGVEGDGKLREGLQPYVCVCVVGCGGP